MYRLFSREISYFSGKVRAALKYKQKTGALPEGYEDILATTDIVFNFLLKNTGSTLLPQLQTPDGQWLLDSSEIMDHLDRVHPEPRIVPEISSPRQLVASLLLEFLGDEWLINYGFWARWHYALDASTENHIEFNAQQWSAIFRPMCRPRRRRALAKRMFKSVLGIDRPDDVTRGPLAGLRDMGINPETEQAFYDSYIRMMEAFEAHLDHHDFTLGGAPSVGDFGLLAPLYAHIYRDPVPGVELRTRFPLVAEWVERTYGANDLNALGYVQKIYVVNDGGKLEPRPASSDDGKVLADDTVPESLSSLLAVFFDEFWPVLRNSMDRLAAFYASHDVNPGDPLPHKSFMASNGFEDAQRGDGPLTVSFEIGGVRSQRMLVPNHIWMLQRLSDYIDACCANGGRTALKGFLAQWPNGAELLELNERLSNCRVKRRGAMLYAAPPLQKAPPVPLSYRETRHFNAPA